MKRFLEWIRIKSALDTKTHRAPDVFEGEVWWASLGENVGSEIYGKDRDFTRPVIIYKRFSRTFYFVIPLTTKSHRGTWYVEYSFNGTLATACLHQGRAIDYRRLSTLLGVMDKASFAQVQEAFRKLYL